MSGLLPVWSVRRAQNYQNLVVSETVWCGLAARVIQGFQPGLNRGLGM